MSPIKSFALPPHLPLRILKENAYPPRKSLPASLVEIVIDQRMQNARSQF
jgi:hypothetical protein